MLLSKLVGVWASRAWIAPVKGKADNWTGIYSSRGHLEQATHLESTFGTFRQASSLYWESTGYPANTIITESQEIDDIIHRN